MEAAVKQLREAVERVRQGGPEQSRRRHLERGKLLVRDRIRKLLDPESAFMELSPLAAWGMYDDEAPGAGIVTGIGRLQGREVVMVANDATVKGGTYYPMTVKKHLRAQEIALQNHLPCMYLVDSGGAFLPLQSEVFPDREHFGRIFYNQARMSAAGIPQVAAVMGSCTAGGAYVPAMCDENIIVRGHGHDFPGWAAAGARRRPARKSAPRNWAAATCTRGFAAWPTHLAEDDEHALAIARDIFESLGRRTALEYRCDRRAPRSRSTIRDEILRHRPARHAPALRGARGDRAAGRRQPIPRVQAALRRNAGHAALRASDGYPVGIIANNGVLFSESALKGDALHRAVLRAPASRCCSCRTSPASWSARDYEQGGIAKDGAKMVNAVANAQVPKFTVIIGASYGAGNYAMCGRGVSPRLLFMWPNCAHLGDGRRAGGQHAAHGQARPIEGPGSDDDARGAG